MEFNEGDIAEDGQGNYMVFRRGAWYPSDSEGVPTQPIPAPEWGQGATELPDGTILGPRGPRGGAPDVLRRGGGGVSGEAPPAISADARNRLVFGVSPATRAVERMAAQQEGGVNPLNRDWAAAAIDALPDFGLMNVLARVVGGQDYQEYDQALKSVEAALLPIFSGMAVTDSEAQRFIRANVPRLGDGPDTVREKTQNLQEVVNAGNWLLGRPLPFPEVGIYNQPGLEPQSGRQLDQATGLPTYSDVTQTNGREIPFASGPGSSPDLAIDVTDRERLLSAGPGSYVRFPDGTVERLSGAPRVGEATGRQVSPGVFAQAETPAQAVAEREAANPILRQIDAGVRGAADALTFGTADEIAAGLETALPITGGASGWTQGFPQAFRQNLARERAIDEADQEDAAIARGTGQIAGALAGGFGAARVAPSVLRNAPRVAGSTAGQTASRIARNTTRQAAIGATGAGAYGFGSAEGDVAERLPETGQAAAIGGVLGPVASKVGESVLAPAAGVVARNIGLAPRRSALESAVARVPDRINPNVLAQRADELEALNIQPALIDVMDDADLGLMRTLNTRPTQAREVGSRLSQERRRNLPTRLRAMAAEEISPETRPMLDIIQATQAERSAAAQEGMAQFGQNTVRLPENVVSILREPLARTALNQAAEVAAISTDPAERQAAARLRQLAAGEGNEITVRDAQNISKALRTSASSAFASQNPSAGPAYRTLAEAIRGAARDQSEGYRAWLQRYADESDLLDAATTGRQFVSPSADPVLERSTEAFIREAQGATAPVRDVQRAAARGAVQAQGAAPTGARSVLESFASDQDMARRAQALGLDPARLRERSLAELRMVESAQRVSPRVGSETGTNLADQAQAAADVMGGAGELLTGRLPSFATRLARRAMSIGFSDREAEALALAAMDPAQTRNVIRQLSQRGMPTQEARNAVRAIRYYASQRSGEMAAGDQ